MGEYFEGKFTQAGFQGLSQVSQGEDNYGNHKLQRNSWKVDWTYRTDTLEGEWKANTNQLQH